MAEHDGTNATHLLETSDLPVKARIVLLAPNPEPFDVTAAASSGARLTQ